MHCGIASIAGCSKSESRADAAGHGAGGASGAGAISEQITADAMLAPLAQAAISPKITAPVKKFYVQRGSHVKAGQLLATLENSDLAAAALDNKGTYTAAQATYADRDQGAGAGRHQKAQLDVAQAKANLDLNQSIVNARKQLFAEGAIPGRDLDTAQAALVQAQAAYDIAAKHLESHEEREPQGGARERAGPAHLRQRQVSGRGGAVELHRDSQPDLRRGHRPAALRRRDSRGRTPLITVMDTSALLAKLHLAQTVAQQHEAGRPATITVPGIDDPVPAKVSLISPALDPGSTTVEVWLRVENPKGTLKAGTPVHASITGTHGAARADGSHRRDADRAGWQQICDGHRPDGTAHKQAGDARHLGRRTTCRYSAGLTPRDMVITTGAYGAGRRHQGEDRHGQRSGR